MLGSVLRSAGSALGAAAWDAARDTFHAFTGGVFAGNPCAAQGLVCGTVPFAAPIAGVSSPGFIVNSAGQAAIVPRGATGPLSTRASGFQFIGGRGGYGLDPRVTGVRFMDANWSQGRRVNYMNSAGQTVDPLTGRTIPNSDPRGHLPFR